MWDTLCFLPDLSQQSWHWTSWGLKKIAAYEFKQAHDHERTAISNLLPELDCRRSLSNGLRAPRKNHGSSPSILKHGNMEIPISLSKDYLSIVPCFDCCCCCCCCDQKKNLAIDVIFKRYTMSERGRKGVVKMGTQVEIARCWESWTTITACSTQQDKHKISRQIECLLSFCTLQEGFPGLLASFLESADFFWV